MNDALDYGKSEAGPVAIGVIWRGIDPIEDLRQVLRLDPTSRVDHAHADERRLDRHLHAHVPACGRVSQGVLKEIPHSPLDELDIGHRENALDIEERVQL